MCVYTIGEIDKFAELNLTQGCFLMYKSFIRPNIESLLENYLKDWQGIERLMFMMVLKHMDAYKTSQMIFQADDDELEGLSDWLDIEAFKKVRWWGIDTRINYLHKNGVIGDNTHRLLHEVRMRRNRVHTFNYVIPDQDRILFAYVYSIIHTILNTMTDVGLGDLANRMRENAEKSSAELMAWIGTMGGKSKIGESGGSG